MTAAIAPPEPQTFAMQAEVTPASPLMRLPPELRLPVYDQLVQPLLDDRGVEKEPER
jgi:hypothetical protein